MSELQFIIKEPGQPDITLEIEPGQTVAGHDGLHIERDSDTLVAVVLSPDTLMDGIQMQLGDRLPLEAGMHLTVRTTQILVRAANIASTRIATPKAPSAAPAESAESAEAAEPRTRLARPSLEAPPAKATQRATPRRPQPPAAPPAPARSPAPKPPASKPPVPKPPVSKQPAPTPPAPNKPAESVVPEALPASAPRASEAPIVEAPGTDDHAEGGTIIVDPRDLDRERRNDDAKKLRPTLLLVSNGKRRVHVITEIPSICGRDDIAQIRLDDPTISKAHARIDFDGESFVVQDQSQNGTWVDDVRLEPGAKAVLKSDSALRFGRPFEALFYCDDPEEREHRLAAHKRAANLLVQRRLITAEQRRDALEEARARHEHVGVFLISQSGLDLRDWAKAIAAAREGKGGSKTVLWVVIILVVLTAAFFATRHLWLPGAS